MASNLNYKPLILEKFEEFSQRCPDYSIGQMFHSILTQLSKRGIDVDTKGSILNITDEQLYSCICKSISDESEDESEN